METLFLILTILFCIYHLYGFYDTINLIRFENGLRDGNKLKTVIFLVCKAMLVFLPFMDKGFHFLTLFGVFFVWIHYKMYKITNPTIYMRLFKKKNAFNFCFSLCLLIYFYYI